jgi:bifunctional non-homologous end joining protein LigD
MTNFGSPLVLPWVLGKPQLMCEVRFIAWTADGLLRHVVFEGLRGDKAANDVWRPGVD